MAEEAAFWLPEGSMVGGRYRLDGVLGAGGYGITYRGFDIRLCRTVAVKEYFPGYMVSRFAEHSPAVHCMEDSRQDYEQGMERFYQEAKTLASLSEVPEVVRVSDYFEENNTAYLVMDFLDGQNLKQMAGGFGGRIPPEILIPVLKPLIEAFTKIHATGLIHRDISPDNIMMLENGTVRLIDFGNARDASNGKSMTLAMKQGFAAPEQYRSHGQGTWTDVYGLCASIYYCLTGKLPPQAMERLTGTPFPTPTELGVVLPEAWETTIMEGLDLFVQKRIQTMEELWERFYGANVLDAGKGEEASEVRFVQRQEENGEEYPSTSPVTASSTDKAAEVESSLQTGLDKIRKVCMQIYRKLKEK